MTISTIYGKPVVELFSLGSLHVSGFNEDGEGSPSLKKPLELVLEPSSGLVRLKETVDPTLMYGQYWYRSGITLTMQNELKSIADSCLKSVQTQPGDVFLDIACNDGTLLKHIPNHLVRIGIDPADDSFKKEAELVSDQIIQDYFSIDSYNRSIVDGKKAKIITVIAMFYDLEDPLAFLQDVCSILDDDGLLVIQMSYTPLMLQQLAFDNICHEHVFYYTLTSISRLLKIAGMKIVDCQLNDVNGGSFRIYVQKKIAKESSFRTAAYRDVALFRVDSILEYEDRLKITEVEPYLKFYDLILRLRERTLSFLCQEKAKGKTIYGYGASTKGNTLLQWFGIDSALITAIAERSSFKHGLKTIGSKIPIISEEQMRKIHPDYLFVLPWHFIDEFKIREKCYLDNGGKFIVPCPWFDVIGNK